MLLKRFLSDSSKQSKTRTGTATKGEMDFVLSLTLYKWLFFSSLSLTSPKVTA